jgi:NAD-dependent SIR2 family protein deacetylase
MTLPCIHLTSCNQCDTMLPDPDWRKDDEYKSAVLCSKCESYFRETAKYYAPMLPKYEGGIRYYERDCPQEEEV